MKINLSNIPAESKNLVLANPSILIMKKAEIQGKEIIYEILYYVYDVESKENKLVIYTNYNQDYNRSIQCACIKHNQPYVTSHVKYLNYVQTYSTKGLINEINNYLDKYNPSCLLISFEDYNILDNMLGDKHITLNDNFPIIAFKCGKKDNYDKSALEIAKKVYLKYDMSGHCV